MPARSTQQTPPVGRLAHKQEDAAVERCQVHRQAERRLYTDPATKTQVPVASGGLEVVGLHRLCVTVCSHSAHRWSSI